MTIAITISGAKVVVPGTYSQFTVEDSLTSVTPGARNIVIIGEAEKGAPGSVLDIRGVYFNEYNKLREYYGSGPIVDAARMLFTTQASPAFAGSVGNVYVYKTNASGLADANVLQSGTTYGVINSAEYGEEGNLISKQVMAGTTEVLPTFTSYWIPKAEAASFRARVSGGAEQTVTVASEALPSEVATALNGLTGVAATGGTLKEVVTVAQVTATDELAVTAAGHRITIEAYLTGGAVQTTFAGANIASVVAGDILYIPAGSAIKGAGDENVGSYVIVSASSSEIVADKISSTAAGVEVAPVAPASVASTAMAGDQTIAAEAELMVFEPVVVSVDAVTAIGTGASLELYNASGTRNIAQRFWYPTVQRNPVTAATAAAASVGIAVASNVGVITISGGSFSGTTRVGEIIWIKPDSPLAGVGSANVGAWTVTAAGSTAITARKVINGGITVASAALTGTENPFVIQTGFASTVDSAILHSSGAEAQVYLSVTRQSDGATFPTTLVGGRCVLGVSYTGTGTSVLSISSSGILTTTCTDSNDDLRVNINQFNTLSDLAVYLSTKTNYAARTLSNTYNSLSPSVLDEVQAIGISGGVSGAAAYNGRIKADYYDFKALVDSDVTLIGFQESALLVNKSGLPSVEAVATFLTGGAIGATTDAAILDGFDASLKIYARMVVPLFSRDASKDVEDGITNEASTYSIDAIIQAAKSHVLTASNALNRKERFAVIGYHGSFEDVKSMAGIIASERIQMCFQLVRTTGSDGNIRWFLPWMEACSLAAGRAQANSGVALLRKSFSVADVKHIGDLSPYSDTLVVDFDPDTKDLDESIEAGLVSLRPVSGFGIRMESPDASTRSRDNDPKAWVYERVSVLFVCDEVLDACRTTLDNYIGNRTTDVSAAQLQNALSKTLDTFVAAGALKSYSVDAIRLIGNGYEADVNVLPAEAIEFITLNVTASRT